MKRILFSIAACYFCISSFALTESDGISFVKSYYQLLTEYATTAENTLLAQRIESMHLGNGHVYPDIEINLGKVPETESVGIKSVYLVSIVARQNLLLKFVPRNITLEGNSNGICTIYYTLYVYCGNEQPGRDVLKYSVPLKMDIQNADKKIVSVLKRATSSIPYTLSVSPSSMSFDASGGTHTLTVTSNTSWSISVNTASWGHLTRNGNTLTLQIDANTETTERTDYFKIKAGDKEERINIKQSGSSNSLQHSAQINSISVSQNQDIDGKNGIIIHVSFDVQNMKGKVGCISAYFYDNDGNALIDLNNSYYTTTGKVATSTNFTPSYDNSTYKDLTLKIPYGELHQSGTYSRTIKFHVSVWDNSVSPHKEIYISSYSTFSYTPSAESYLKVDNSTSDKVKNFSESGGRETYYVSTSENSYETWGVPSWCRIENKTSSSFTLVCDPNTSSSNRSDYMKVKAGGKEIRIDIKQDGQSSSASVENCWLSHNLYKSMWNGFMWANVPYMQIHVHFSVEGHKGENVRVCAFFYFSNGNRVNAVNAEFRTSDGQATVQGIGNCSYDNTEWKDYTLEIPYYALPKGSLYVEVQIQDKNGNYLAESSDISFSVI